MGLTIAMLSWGAEKTLQHTLESYAYHDLRAEQKIILLQEGTPMQESMARYYGFTPHSYPINIGIANGYRALLDLAEHEHFLFLENDWELLENPIGQINMGLYLLKVGDVDLIRLRSRKTPGWPLWTKQFEGQEHLRKTHLLDAIHWTELTRFPEITRVQVEAHVQEDERWRVKSFWWYIASSKYANWTNNPHMARTDFLLREVAPRFGTKDGEVDIQSWWEQQDFKVAQSEGLFTHNRLD